MGPTIVSTKRQFNPATGTFEPTTVPSTTGLSGLTGMAKITLPTQPARFVALPTQPTAVSEAEAQRVPSSPSRPGILRRREGGERDLNLPGNKH